MEVGFVIVCLLLPFVGYLLASIPFAFVIGKANGIDIRTVGSHNIGATNLGRTLGKKYFWYAFALDAGKGFLPVLMASLLLRSNNWGVDAINAQEYALRSAAAATNPNVGIPHYSTLPMWSPLLTAIACVLGHTFPLWLKFKGGKGVATSFGVVLGFWPLYTLAGIGGGIVFVVMLLAYRYISLASMTGVSAFAVLVMLLGFGYFDFGGTHLAMSWNDLLPLVIVAWLFAGLIAFRHRANIGRLLKGTEPKIGQKQRDAAAMKDR